MESRIPLKEIALTLTGVMVVFTTLAMLSYSPMDPAWSVAGTDLEVRNVVGRFGAFTADVALMTFGWSAYLLPLGCLYWVMSQLFGRLRLAIDVYNASAAVRVSGLIIATVGLCTLFALHQSSAGLPAGAGGVVGTAIVRLSLVALGSLGLTIIAFSAVLLGLQAAMGFSWVDVVERIGRLIVLGFRAALDWWQRRQGRATSPHVPQSKYVDPGSLERREEVLEPDAEAVAPPKRKPPRFRAREVEVVPVAERPSPLSQKKLFKPTITQEMPDVDLLEGSSEDDSGGFSDASLQSLSHLLELKLADFGVEAEVVSVLPGPVVTRFEIQPAAGIKVSKISGLAKDLARSLAVISVRIVEVIPGKSVVGIEIPNESREIVRLRDILDTPSYRESSAPLTLALGKDISGQPFMTDISKMPHLLVAGTTGSGKSVGINAMLISMLYKSTPEDLRLILVDPKMLELAVYDGIPHLLTPVVTDMKEAAHALNWCVAEMERRYRVMASIGVRNLAGYNRRVAEANAAGEPLIDVTQGRDLDDEEEPTLGHLPFVVVVIDEFADMMMIVGKKVEQLIARIAQKARAAGIHLVLATQRPSVDVITGLIKANIPARIGFQVSSKIDSRTILDQGGAEQLLGHGDMLFLPPGTAVPIRLHGAFVSDEEVHAVVADWKARGNPDYIDAILGDGEMLDVSANLPGVDAEGESEPLYDEAVAFVFETRRASISAVQRKFRIGYNRAARLIETMEHAGLVTPMNSNGSREVVVPSRD